jgi:uncharacterized protein (DUF433 family)
VQSQIDESRADIGDIAAVGDLRSDLQWPSFAVSSGTSGAIAVPGRRGICCNAEPADHIACPDVMGGAAVFHGTRVPIQTLLDYLEAGESIDGFLAGLPSVTREQVIAFLEEAKDRMVESVS